MLRLTICSFLKEIDDVATECERELPYHLEKIKARDLNLNMCNSFQISAASHWCRESMDLTHCWSSNLFAELVRDSLHRVGDSLAELDQESFWSGDKHWNCFNQLVDQTRDFRIETNYLPGSAPAHCERCSWTLNDERHLQIEWPWRFELKSENFRPALPHGYGRCDRTSSIFSPKTFIGDFGKDHQYAITRFGLLNSVCIDFIVWPNQFDFSTPPPDLAGWWGSLDEPQNAPYYETKGNSYRQTWLDCAWISGHFDAISQSYRPNTHDEFRSDGVGRNYGYGSSFERLLWLRWKAGEKLKDTDLQFMKHNAVRKISQVAYRNKNEWRSRIQGKLQDLDSETNSYLDIYIADGINLEWLCDAERSLMTNILDESHKDMREARGLRLDPNKWTNESSLVRLIRKYWPRAKREFSPDWLDRQDLMLQSPT